MFAVSPADAFFPYEVLHTHHTIENCFRSWRTTGNIHVYRYHLVNPLQHTVAVEYTTTTSASPNCYHPARLGHLEIYLLYYGCHFFGDRSHHHQQIALAGRKSQTLRT